MSLSRLRRAAAPLAVLGAITWMSAARPFAAGVTYQFHTKTTPPEIPGMAPQEAVEMFGHGSRLGTQLRMDFDSSRGPSPFGVGSYMLMLDSARMYIVDPATKTYSDPLSSIGAAQAMLPGGASLTNVNVTTEALGPSDTIQGYPTKKFRVTTTYSMSMVGAAFNVTGVQELWVAPLPWDIQADFSSSAKRLSEGPMHEISEKSVEAQKAIGPGTRLRAIGTNTIAGPITMTTTTTSEITDIKPGEVDPALFKVPEGYTKKP